MGSLVLKVYQKIVNFYINFPKHHFELLTDDVRFFITNENEINVAFELRDNSYRNFPLKLIDIELKNEFLKHLYIELEQIFGCDFYNRFKFKRYIRKSNILLLLFILGTTVINVFSIIMKFDFCIL